MTRIARSAPIASPVRSCSCHALWPIAASTTSPAPCFSLIRRASSIAISSNGLITHLTLSVAIPEPSGRTRIVVAGSGTRLIGTRIFTAVHSTPGAQPWPRDRSGVSGRKREEPNSEPRTDQRRVPPEIGEIFAAGSRSTRCSPDGRKARLPASRISGAISLLIRSPGIRYAGPATASEPTTVRV